MYLLSEGGAADCSRIAVGLVVDKATPRTISTPGKSGFRKLVCDPLHSVDPASHDLAEALSGERAKILLWTEDSTT